MSAGWHIFNIIMVIITGMLWLIVYIPALIICGVSNRNKRDDLLEEQNKLLKQIAEQNKWRDYRD